MKNTLRSKLVLTLLLVSLIVGLCACTSQTQTEQTGAQTTEAPTEVSTEVTTEAPTEESTEETYVLSANSPLDGLPEYTYDSWEYYWDMGNGAEMLVYTAENGDGYTQYLTDLEAAGYTLYAENEIEGNLFSTWTDDDTNVTLMYSPGLENVRILAEPAGALPGLEADNVYTDAGVENVITMVGVNYDGETTNGMCFIYRLCDGSFIIVDSGFNQTACADAIYETLCELAPDPDNIVIASYFITHAHADHVGGFYAFASAYADKVTVEQIVYNYPTAESFTLSDTSTGHITKTLQHAAYFEGAEIIEAHPGQVFYLRDLVIEILYTWDLYPSNTIDYMNNSSLVFTITFDDADSTQMIHLGDCGPYTSRILMLMYNETLKSDIIQVAHHGYKGASEVLNIAIDADVILWPASQAIYSKELYDASFRNRPFWNAENLYVADTIATVIPIPFDAEAVQTWELYDTAK